MYKKIYEAKLDGQKTRHKELRRSKKEKQEIEKTGETYVKHKINNSAKGK